MQKTMLILAGLGLTAVWAGSRMAADDGPAGGKPAKPADMEIRANAAEYCAAFNKGDAKAVAAFWTENCEFHDDDGTTLVGRAAIEKAYAGMFKENPKGKMTVEISSIRYPARDLAIEEGTTQVTSGGAAPPVSTRYQAVNVREDGKWKIAMVEEMGAGEEKLQDLSWLIGTWTANIKDRDVRITYEWGPKKNCVISRSTATSGGKTIKGTTRITQDPVTGRIRAFSSDDQGTQGMATWSRDGDRWVAEANGVTPDGAETSGVVILTRLGDDEVLWRSVDRTVSGAPVPDPLPVKLTRVKSGS